MLEDRDIVNLFISRDENAISATKEKYGRRLNRLSYGLTEDINAADECENDTYLQTWNTIPPNKPHEYLYPYLARILRHIALDLCKSRNRLKRKATIEELSLELQQTIPDASNTEDLLMESELKELLNKYLHELSFEKRSIFIRRYWFMDSVKTISDGYGISQSKVKVTLHRCREELKKLLENEGYNI